MRIALSCLMGLWWVAGALPDTTLRPEAGAGEGVVGFALPSHREQRWRRDLAVVVEEAKHRGVEVKYRIANNDQDEQNRQIDEMLEEGIDVLMLAAHDTTTVVETIQRVRAKGVQVVVYDRMVNDCAYELYIGFDSPRVGVLQGEWITKRVPKGNYVVMSGAATDANAALFRSGVDQVLAPFVARGDIKIVMDREVTDWDPAVAEKIVLEALDAQNNRIDAIIAPNDGTAGGAIKALASRGLAGKIPVTGHDGDSTAAERIQDGTQGMTVLKDTRMLGREGLRMAARLSRKMPLRNVPGMRTIANGKTQVPAILMAPSMVDAGNLQKELIDSGYLVREGNAIKAIEDALPVPAP